MRRALAAALLGCALTAHAQAPPDTAPPPTPQAAPATAPGAEPAASPAEVSQPPPAAITPQQAEQPAPHPPAPVRAAVARPQAPARELPPAAAAAPPHPPAERDQLVVELREEVNRLQSELDAERAAAVPPPEEGTAQQRNAWGWLVVVALAGLAAGFVLGWRLLDRRIRRKYGGLRIY